MHIKIKNGKSKYTPFGGTFLISALYESMYISSYVDSQLKKAVPIEVIKHQSTLSKSLIMGFICGIECIMDMDYLSRDVALKDIWGLKGVPHSSRIGDWLYRNSNTAVPDDIVSNKAVDNIGKIFRDIAYKIIKKRKDFERKALTLDSDTTYIEAKKQGVSKKSYKVFMV